MSRSTPWWLALDSQFGSNVAAQGFGQDWATLGNKPPSQIHLQFGDVCK